ncbi:CapA family protein [Candidatus Stoquefichus massiliensis]|uniref:CapA family protein n=1 Tax=Candidatus Stoquefichus massiliensis TaxID=1470350 RepID=UPI000481ECE7|nr:CapA family protein [Candidatus Stoquefichus massiliensis]
MKKISILIVAMLLMVGCSGEKDAKKDTPVTKENTVSFTAVGDNLMHQLLLDKAKTNDGYDFMPYYANIQSYIQKADFAFVNQETILGGGKASGYPNFNTPDIMAKNLSDVGFDIVNGATNHTLDKGGDAVIHSINVFKQYKNMNYIGVYESQEKRDDITVVEKNGIKIALLSYNQLTNGHKMPNTYCMNLFDEKTIKKDVENAKEISDFVIVSCHWGNEYDTVPDAFQKKYAKLFADLGVDVIIGTHSHTLQPVEWVEGKDGHKTLVAYSLGNFVSGMMEEETQLEGMLSFDLKKEDNRTSIDNVVLTPLVNHYEITNLKDAYGTRQNFTVYRLKDYSEELASQHGLNGYQGITIDFSKMKEKVKKRITSGIQIDM